MLGDRHHVDGMLLVLNDLKTIASQFDDLASSLSALSELECNNLEDLRRLEAARDSARRAAQLIRLQIEAIRSSSEDRE